MGPDPSKGRIRRRQSPAATQHDIRAPEELAKRFILGARPDGVPAALDPAGPSKACRALDRSCRLSPTRFCSASRSANPPHSLRSPIGQAACRSMQQTMRTAAVFASSVSAFKSQGRTAAPAPPGQRSHNRYSCSTRYRLGKSYIPLIDETNRGRFKTDNEECISEFDLSDHEKDLARSAS